MIQSSNTTSIVYISIFSNYQVNVNSKAVLVGCRGIASPATISKLAEESVKQDLLGIMVWYVNKDYRFLFIYLWHAFICLQFL